MPPELTSTFTPTPMNKKEWEEKYWFTSLQMVTVINPAWFKGEHGNEEPVSADYPFMVEMRHFIIRAGQQEKLPGIIANVYLDQMTKILAQNDDKLGFMSDPALMKYYYDKLIVEVEDLAPKYDPTPAYLRNLEPGIRTDAPSTKAPWEDKKHEVDTAPLPNPTNESDDTVETEKDEPKERQFDYEGANYKMVVAKNGHKLFYKNGLMISNAEYNRIASML